MLTVQPAVGKWPSKPPPTPPGPEAAMSGRVDRTQLRDYWSMPRADANLTRMLRVSPNGRYLVDRYGDPFFYLGDTAWELLHRLTRREIEHYLSIRAQQRFTVVQTVLLAEFDGLRTPNAEGELPLIDLDPTRPNDRYFRLVDWVVACAQNLGLVMGLLPTWGDKWNQASGHGPEIFTPENALVYGRFLANRYKDAPVIWILGGDRKVENDTHRAIHRAMARGLRQEMNTPQLITFHPYWHEHAADTLEQVDQGKEPFLDFLMHQSGHIGRETPNDELISRDYSRTPVRPVIDGEPNYEEHPIMLPGWKRSDAYFNDLNIRQSAYRSLLAGACGFTYGAHPVWQFFDPDHAHSVRREPINGVRMSWTQALNLPGAWQMRHLRVLFQQVPLPASEQGSHRIYYVTQGVCNIDTPGLAHWFDPRDGQWIEVGPIRNGPLHPPDPQDWVLVIKRDQQVA